MMYLGDFKQGTTHRFFWGTNDSDGGSVSRATKGTIYVIKDGDVDGKVTTGLTDTEDVAGGLHKCTLDLSDDFYEAGSDYSVVLLGAVIDSQTVNSPLAEFSVENRYAGSELFEKAARVLVNKAVQNKITCAIEYYDDEGQTVILTHTPEDTESQITRTPS